MTSPTTKEALTDAQIHEVILQTVYEGDGTIPYRAQWSQDIGLPFARAIEAEVRAALASEPSGGGAVAIVESWPNDRTPLGIVPLVSMDDLPVGTKLYTRGEAEGGSDKLDAATVVRSVQPKLAEDSKAWRDLCEECQYWLDARAAIAAQGAR